MKTIYRNKTKFQSLLDSLIFIFNLLFGLEPETPTIKPVFPNIVNPRRIALEKAVRAFELKKSGGVSR